MQIESEFHTDGVEFNKRTGAKLLDYVNSNIYTIVFVEQYKNKQIYHYQGQLNLNTQLQSNLRCIIKWL